MSNLGLTEVAWDCLAREQIRQLCLLDFRVVRKVMKNHLGGRKQNFTPETINKIWGKIRRRAEFRLQISLVLPPEGEMEEAILELLRRELPYPHG